MTRLVLFNKPFQVLSQFRAHENKVTLAHYIDDPALRLAGRLDYDSEGLVLLSDDGSLVQQITHPRFKLPKTYWAQVEGLADDAALEQLRRGVALKDGMTLPAAARRMPEPDALWSRNPPVRFRAQIPTSWIELMITEGRNRQVRRMTAAVGLPTLRLIRVSVGNWSLGNLQPGQQREVSVPRRIR
jgi:23S rRNA pseudouridine2457 synthase